MIINSLSRKSKEFFINAHRATNHMYEEGVPYEVHLELTADIARTFAIDEGFNSYQTELAISGAWGHDSVSDARLTYNDINKGTGSNRLAKICCNLCEDV